MTISTRCCDADRQVLHRASGSTSSPYCSDSSATSLAGRRPVEQADARGLLDAEHDVLRHREDRDQHEVLVHHADAGRDGVARAVERRTACRR